MYEEEATGLGAMRSAMTDGLVEATGVSCKLFLSAEIHGPGVLKWVDTWVSLSLGLVVTRWLRST